jgi:hypothetical protein
LFYKVFKEVDHILLDLLGEVENGHGEVEVDLGLLEVDLGIMFLKDHILLSNHSAT